MSPSPASSRSRDASWSAKAATSGSSRLAKPSRSPTRTATSSSASRYGSAGMPAKLQASRGSTVNAATTLKCPELGSLKAGSVGDATVLTVREGAFDYVDVVGEVMRGDRKIMSEGVVIGGKWWHPR